ncbi:unnamed protein product [Allacma fusca]|uniref:Pre-mRNA-splicing factor SLU7 n=1 Tax=Allacma fusca TaxID=39272 RepID=A0A8J2JK41_9HEXA|nr:unnamed protein product [Allacma fusca]
MAGSAASSLALSDILRSKEDDAQLLGDNKGKSRDDWKKAKELEEARKAGTAPAAVDEEGRDINPHIPQYISSAPWYYGAKGPTLKHQRTQPETKKVFSTLDEWYHRGVDVAKVATRFRKGACENCGALTHKRKDCMERPRRVGARFTGDAIAPDEHLQPNLEMDYDGKRDRWNGYDPNEYHAIVDEFQMVEDAKRSLKTEKIRSGTDGEPLPDNMVLDEDIPEEDEDKYVDDVDMPGTKVDSKQRITVRNLRIREDVAKYLRNLDPNSAYYDPKTRAMRDNPYKGTVRNPEEVDYAGENFVRFSGDTNKHATAQLFAWEAHERGVDVHLLAEPTKLEVLQREFDKHKEDFKGSLTKNIIDKYGGDVHLKAPPKTLLLAQTEDYVEYSRQGKIIKGNEKPIIRSKYEEDVYPNNHSSVYGSYWRDGQWGYQCCHSLIRLSYCTGQAGRSVNDETSIEEAIRAREAQEEIAKAVAKQRLEAQKTLVEIHQEKMEKEKEAQAKSHVKSKKRKEKRKKKKSKRKASSSESSSSESSDSDSESDDDRKKKKELKKALAMEEKRERDAEAMLDDRKRNYNSRYDVKAPTEVEMEAYFMKRARDEDPMLDFISSKKKK